MEPDNSSNNRVDVSQIFTQTEVEFDYYSCEKAISRLNEYLDHELTPGERADVVKHLEICEPCLERFSFEENLIVSIRTKMQKICCPNALKSKLSSLIKGTPKQ
jgi:anti-sigma factor (TIGR02949 family)